MTEATTTERARLVIGGRVFAPVTTTTGAQQNWVTSRLWATMQDGIDSTPAMLAAIAEADAFGAVLAGLLTEVDDTTNAGRPWTARDAKLNAAFFDGPSTVDDVGALQGVLVGLIVDFFPNAGPSSLTSPSLSAEASPALPTSEHPRTAEPASAGA